MAARSRSRARRTFTSARDERRRRRAAGRRRGVQRRGTSVAPSGSMRGFVPVGRALFALIFVASAVGHFSSAQISEAAAHGVPFASILVPLAGVVALVGGVSVMI